MTSPGALKQVEGGGYQQLETGGAQEVEGGGGQQTEGGQVKQGTIKGGDDLSGEERDLGSRSDGEPTGQPRRVRGRLRRR